MTRHADLGANLWRYVLVSVRCVLEALVAVSDQSGHVFLLGKGFGERLYNQFVVVMFAELVGYNFIVELSLIADRYTQQPPTRYCVISVTHF
ncbi:hypothetical protein [Paenibacillus polymyxa]|uniref:hypothetical protein n=1 Tax=Paenibacillus polymyxa TaxID=1406 RepID=UPI0012DB218C|nr:hypothetical protein [Paenibacillus polymyxa]